jgi:hypothetical protein
MEPQMNEMELWDKENFLNRVCGANPPLKSAQFKVDATFKILMEPLQ